MYKVILVFIVIVGINGCTDDESQPCQPNDGIIGTWSLIEVFETFIGPHTISPNEVIWVFEDNVLTISFIDGFDKFDGIPRDLRESTQFDFIIEGDVVIINGVSWSFSLDKEGSELALKEVASIDGSRLTFESNCP